MSCSPVHPTPEAGLAEVALAADAALPGAPGAYLLGLVGDRLHRVPLPRSGDLLAGLRGLRVPLAWTGVGLAIGGGDVRLSTVRDRSVRAASVLTTPDAGSLPIHEPPGGRAADVLARLLGCRTAPPPVSVPSWIESLWLDRLAEEVLDRPSRRWRWADLARHHPLAGWAHGSRPPAGAELALEVLRMGQSLSWSQLRDLVPDVPGRDARVVADAIGGWVAPLSTWFDDGSLCRWFDQALAPATELLGVLEELIACDAVLAELDDALTTVAAVPPGPA